MDQIDKLGAFAETFGENVAVFRKELMAEIQGLINGLILKVDGRTKNVFIDSRPY